MDTLIQDFRQAYAGLKGDQLAETLRPDIQLYSSKLLSIWGRGDARAAQSDIQFLFYQDQSRPRLSKEETTGWYEIYIAYWTAVGEILAAEGLRGDVKSSWKKVYEAWKELTLLITRGYTNHDFENWTIPCLYVAGRYLRLYAIRADEERRRSGEDAVTNFQDDFDPESEENKHLEDCARQLNRIFNLCLSDRAPLEESRKWGIYYAINLLFKTYFKLNAAGLSKNVLKALSATRGDMPALNKFPASQQVTFKYYEGVLAFLEESYVEGDLHAFDMALQGGEDEFIKRRIYLTLERGRDIALRNLLRKVFIAGGYEESKNGAAPVRRTRIPVAEFAAAMKVKGGVDIDTDEVECLLANMIYKNLMKGYIAHERGFVVLSKTGAFPGTGV
ncbi:COP9 signalosome (CSN) subunit [Diatrype stigma]|uniref:Protein CSN12 homolog n=1 Tax=Diatrype stigma TaxID=117547 RepID=A0AAN9YLW4_9PEZI